MGQVAVSHLGFVTDKVFGKNIILFDVSQVGLLSMPNDIVEASVAFSWADWRQHFERRVAEMHIASVDAMCCHGRLIAAASKDCTAAILNRDTLVRIASPRQPRGSCASTSSVRPSSGR